MATDISKLGMGYSREKRNEMLRKEGQDKWNKMFSRSNNRVNNLDKRNVQRSQAAAGSAGATLGSTVESANNAPKKYQDKSTQKPPTAADNAQMNMVESETPITQSIQTENLLGMSPSGVQTKQERGTNVYDVVNTPLGGQKIEVGTEQSPVTPSLGNTPGYASSSMGKNYFTAGEMDAINQQARDRGMAGASFTQDEKGNILKDGKAYTSKGNLSVVPAIDVEATNALTEQMRQDRLERLGMVEGKQQGPTINIIPDSAGDERKLRMEAKRIMDEGTIRTPSGKKVVLRSARKAAENVFKRDAEEKKSIRDTQLEAARLGQESELKRQTMAQDALFKRLGIETQTSEGALDREASLEREKLGVEKSKDKTKQDALTTVLDQSKMIDKDSSLAILIQAGYSGEEAANILKNRNF